MQNNSKVICNHRIIREFKRFSTIPYDFKKTCQVIKCSLLGVLEIIENLYRITIFIQMISQVNTALRSWKESSPNICLK